MTEVPRLGVVLPCLPQQPLAELAADLEAAGAGAIWLTDHLFWHVPTLDVIGALPVVAGATSTAWIGPGVLQLPMRSVASTAKSMAYLHHLAPGRVAVGVGVGEHQAEYDAAGVGDRFGRRGRLLDDGIAGLRTAWAADGAFAMAPTAALPVWVGGRSERARHRAVALGDGWMPHLCRPTWFANQMTALDHDLAGAGREPASLVRAAIVTAAVDGIEPQVDPTAWLGHLYDLDPRTFGRVLLRGSADAIAAEIARFYDAGAQHVTVMVAGDRPAEHLAAIRHALA